ncbi:aminotransferase class I/II-fold pyridoxal phosphate-dependent enzyme [Oscillospiraceae bacterium HV4-5-C5C]|nr:aminotransferase class I/II-fold pyridoxal phosphate-dependent enzyme [Oscillospiraceae bacterium HV4-5-C5C]
MSSDKPTSPRLSDRVQSIPPSGIRRFFDLANEMKGEVISLSIGEPDFVTPWTVREAGMYSLESGRTHYTANQGMKELRQAVSDYAGRRFSLHYDPLKEIMITVGGSEAIDDAIRALVNPGEEVLVPEPAYVAYNACVKLAGACPRSIPLSAKYDFKLQPQQLEAAITAKTRLLIMAYPNNPTGAVMDRQDLEALLPVLQAHPDITVISDELYAELTYAPNTFTSPAVIPELKSRCVVIGGFSKAFAMTGWRLGYAMAPADVIAAMNKIHQYVIMSAPTLAQYAALEALRHSEELVRDMREEYDGRRRVLLRRLHDMGLPCFIPGGAFYAFPDISSTGLSSEAFCEQLLFDQKVAVVPGTAFGNCAEGYIRISYAASLENIETAMQRMADFVARHRTLINKEQVKKAHAGI